jgi:hypothetical protein
MALNPELRVLRIDDGSYLDSDSLEALRGMANAEDYQIWCERVEDDDRATVVIEDGRVRPQPE